MLSKSIITLIVHLTTSHKVLLSLDLNEVRKDKKCEYIHKATGIAHIKHIIMQLEDLSKQNSLPLLL